MGLDLSPLFLPLPEPLPFLGFSHTVTSTSLPDSTASSSPPPDIPNAGSASFLPEDQIENANDEAEAEADPGQDEAVAMVDG